MDNVNKINIVDAIIHNNFDFDRNNYIQINFIKILLCKLVAQSNYNNVLFDKKKYHNVLFNKSIVKKIVTYLNYV